MKELGLWSGAAIAAAAFVTWAASRWWYLRRVAGMRRHVQRLEAAQQNAARNALQTRKQIEDLQRTVDEYRRRLSVHDAARRARGMPVEPAPKSVVAAVVEMEDPVVQPGGWADTQPMM